MLNCTTQVYSGCFEFRIFGTKTLETQILSFVDKYIVDDTLREKKLTAVLNAINTAPLIYSNEEKFKHLEDDVWEIKIKQIRIACIWDKKPSSLIAIYGFFKKRKKWSANDLSNMRNQKQLYFSKRQKAITRGHDEHTRQTPKQLGKA